MDEIEPIEKRIDWGGMLLLLSYGPDEQAALADMLYKAKVEAYEQSVLAEARRMGFEVDPEQVNLGNQQTKSFLRKQANQHAGYIVQTHNKDLAKKLDELETGPKYPLKNRFQLAQEVDQWATGRFAKRATLIARTESFSPLMLGAVDFYTQNGIEAEFVFNSSSSGCSICKRLMATSPHSVRKVKRIGIPHPNCVHSWTPIVRTPVHPPGGQVWLGGPYRTPEDA